MLWLYSNLLDVSVLLFLTFFGSVATAFLLGVAFHEFSHAFAADRLGDHTARFMGRVSLDPRRHIDPAGAVFFFLAGFGWGKPTPVNPNQLRNGPVAGRAVVSAAGPISNLLFAAVASVPLHAGLAQWHGPFGERFGQFFVVSTTGWTVSDYVGLYLSSLIIFNVILAVFNLIPLAPLDGFAVLAGLLPRDLAMSFLRFERYGPMVLMLLLILPLATNGHFSILYEVMSPITNSFTRIISDGNLDSLV